MTISSY